MLLRRIDHWRTSAMLGQLVRFVVAGGFTTLLYTIVYSPLAKYQVTSEQVANLCGYLVAASTGYLLHSHWSFRGHAHGDNAARTGPRFFAVSLVSYGMNSVFVWVLTAQAMLSGPWWWPLVPILFVTPLVTFALNRLWVFA